jgi:hypothetical protein
MDTLIAMKYVFMVINMNFASEHYFKKGKRKRKKLKKIPFWLHGVRGRYSTAGYWRRHFTVKQNTRSWNAGYAKQLSANNSAARYESTRSISRRKLSRFIQPAIMRNRIRCVHARKSVRLQLVALIARGKSRGPFVTKNEMQSPLVDRDEYRGCIEQMLRRYGRYVGIFPAVSPLFSCVFFDDNAVNRLTNSAGKYSWMRCVIVKKLCIR